MAMVQAVMGGRGLHLQCCSSSSSSSWRGAPSAVRHPITAPPLSVGRQWRRLVVASANPEKNEKPKRRRETKLMSVALPILATVVVTKSTGMYNDTVFIDTFNDWTMDEKMVKDLYMVISMVFCWGCCVFGSMNDPYYESDEYRKAGGNGTQHWMYYREEMDEQEAREELFREELVKEIEGKVGELRELEGADTEKETELV